MSKNLEDEKKHGGGPKTPEGKRRSSLNSVRHGLLARTVVLPTEDANEFQELLDDYIRDFAPQTRFELDLIHELAAARWRIHRIWGMESTILIVGIDRSRQALNTEYPSENDADIFATTFGFMQMSGGDRSLQLLHRYESRLTKRFHQIQAELRTIAKERARAVEQASACDSASSKRRTAQKNLPNELPKPVLLPARDDKNPPKNGKLPPEEDDAA